LRGSVGCWLESETTGREREWKRINPAHTCHCLPDAHPAGKHHLAHALNMLAVRARNHGRRRTTPCLRTESMRHSHPKCLYCKQMYTTQNPLKSNANTMEIPRQHPTPNALAATKSTTTTQNQPNPTKIPRLHPKIPFPNCLNKQGEQALNKQVPLELCKW